ncbi:MAG: glutamine synthetase family protein, partial [Actinomycetes bacterium]
GLRVLASFEHEFVVRGAAGAPFSWQRARSVEPLGAQLLQLLDACGLRPETWLPEYGPEQFEITLEPAEGVAAADRAILLRELVRDLGRRLDREVSFAPMQRPDGVGSGVHVHLSLVDDDGVPVMADLDRVAALSDLGAAFCGGILAHAPALLAVAAPSVASFLRLQPHRWSAGVAALAERDREALLRVCPTSSLGGGDRRAQLNVEFRAADGTSNPWLVLGSLVRAGLEGLDGHVAPARVLPEGTDVLAQVTPVRLPRTLREAIEELDADTVARSWFPEPLISTFLSVKRAELAEAAGLDDAAVCEVVSRAY